MSEIDESENIEITSDDDCIAVLTSLESTIAEAMSYIEANDYDQADELLNDIAVQIKAAWDWCEKQSNEPEDPVKATKAKEGGTE